MYNLQEITAKILNTPPYQLPPVIHTGGIYQVDVNYRGVSFHKVSPYLEDCMSSYFDFAVRVNDRHRFKGTDFDKVPVPLGSSIPHQITNSPNQNKEVTNG